MADTVFLIEDPNITHDVINTIKQHKDAKIFSLNYFTHRSLTKNNIKHEFGESILTAADKKLIDQRSIDITINWSNHNSIKQFLVFNEINLANLIELELSQYILPVCRSALSIIRIMEKEKPQIVITYTYLNDFLKRFCEEKNIKLILIEKTQEPTLQYDKINIKFNIGPIPLSFTISRANYQKIKKFFDKVIELVFGLNPPTKSKTKSILLLEFNSAVYDVLIQELSKLKKNILLLNQRRPTIWNFRSLQIVKNSKCKIIDLNYYENKIQAKLDNEVKSFLNKLSTLWNQNEILEEIFSIHSHTFWYSIKNSFTIICNSRFSEAIRRILLLNEMFDEFNISAILEWAELGQEEKEVLFIAKKRGIQSVMLQHAMFPTSRYWDPFARFLIFFSYPLISNKQALWGELTKQHALSYGYNQNLIVTGSPRHDRFFEKPKVHKKGIILFATTQVSGIDTENSTTMSYVKFDNFVKEVCRISKKFPDKKLVVKPHPAPNFINNLIELIKEIDPSITITHTTNLAELIESCDVLITFNNSTIALDSIILGKPTISLQIEKWTEDSEIVKMGAILSISDINQIENGIRKMLYDTDFRTKIQENAKKFVKSYLANRGSASKALARVLDEI